MHGIVPMSKLIIRRRPDGVIEVRKPRLRDDRTMRELTVLLGLCVGCVAFIATLATLLVMSPVVLTATAAFALLGLPTVLITRNVHLVPATARPPSPPPPNHAA
jgi:hypothetical protein